MYLLQESFNTSIHDYVPKLETLADSSSTKLFYYLCANTPHHTAKLAVYPIYKQITQCAIDHTECDDVQQNL